MTTRIQPLLPLYESDLTHHGLVTQREALLACAQTGDHGSLYRLYSQAIGSAVLIPSGNGEECEYYLMTRLSEVQWVRREGDEAVVLWDFNNEVVVVMRLQEGCFDTRVLASTVLCEEATPVSIAA